MPHVVVRGALQLAALARAFQPILLRRGGDVLKAERIFLEAGGSNALVECLVVEAGRKQPFYVKIAVHDARTTVRVDPLCRVERSSGVKALVAEIGGLVLDATPDGAVEVTNLVLPSDEGGVDEHRE